MNLNPDVKAAHRVRPLIRWPGGKTRLLPHILPLLQGEHVCYCEPFAGGLAVMLAKTPSPKEVVNDLNGDLVALYNNVKHHLPEMEREIDWLLNSRKQLYDFLREPGLTEIQRAVRWLWRNKISFGGGGRTFGVGKTASGGATQSKGGVLDQMRALSQRLDRVSIENVPYERCMDLYDSKATLFFIDPPYLHANVPTYAGWTEEQMTSLRSRLDRTEGRWILTVDGSDFNKRLFKDCRIRTVVTKNCVVNNRLHSKATFPELIITPKT